MDEIDLLPQELKSQSLSDREIVLPYKEALDALDILVANNWACLAWEGWIKYTDGRHGHSQEHQGTQSIGRADGEQWLEYVKRSESICRTTMEEAVKLWKENPEAINASLYFCITALQTD